MQETLPITVTADERFSNSIKPLLNKLEMWLNFQALKANWYGDEDLTLIFDFTLVRTLEEKTKNMSADNWTIETGFAYHYESSNQTTIAFIAIADLVQNKTGVEQSIKSRLTRVANAIAKQHSLVLI